MARKILIYVIVILGTLIFGGWAMPEAAGRAAGSPAPSNVTAEQQKMPDQLSVLRDQLRKDRAAVHDAIGKFGFKTSQADAARDQLIRDRAQYRQLRRSMATPGLASPAARGMRGIMARDNGSGARFRGMTRGGSGCQCRCAGI
jgi:hypothetical protein